MKTQEEFEAIVCNMRKSIMKMRNDASDDQMYYLAEAQLYQMELSIHNTKVNQDLIDVINELIEKVMGVAKSNSEALDHIKEALIVLCAEVNSKPEEKKSEPSPHV